jgi:predicted Zn-dependent protease
MATFRCSLLLVAACSHAKPISTAPLPRAAYAHYLNGKLALYKDDAKTAAEEFQAAAAAAPDQPAIAVEEAHALVKAHRDNDARAVLLAARSRWPEQAQVWLASGEVLEKGAPAEAIRAYAKAIELDRDSERAYLGLARLQEAPAAERTLRGLVARIPASVDGHYRLAQKLAARGETSGAEKEWRAVLERDPDHIDARLDLARVLRRAGRLKDAIAETRSAFDRAGQPMDIAEELYWLLCEANDMQGAIDLLTLLDDERSDAEALATVARLQIGLGRLDQASALAKKIGAMDNGAAVAALLDIQIALARHDYKTALTRAKASDAKAARLYEIEVAIAQGDTKLARDLVGALKDLPDLDRTIYEARIREKEHDVKGALSVLEPYIHAHPDSAAALNLAGYLLADSRQRLGDAETYLKRARELSPGDPAVLDSWGWLLTARGRKEAIPVLEHAARFAPLEPEIRAHLDAARRVKLGP